ncbi:MAG: hypothetical protein HYU63_06350 [Armatimonadetes bacterium]|nr:hypothetical protein [Armatimonadota bacterium]
MEFKHVVKKFYPRSFPKISKTIFRFNSFPPLNNSKNKIGFFTGCMIDYFYPQIGLALVNFFKNNNWEVVIPKEQTCCGLPLFSLGNPSLAKKFILKNLEVFEKLKLDYIVFACPSCLGTMKVKLKILLNEEELKKFDNLIKSFIDFSQIFALFNFKYKKLNKSMLYHFSCHLNRRVKIKEELKGTINYLGGEKIKLVEDLCCGFGGVFNFDYYDLSMKINHRLIKVIQENNPQIVLSSCPGCIFQIESGLRKENINNLKVKHLVEAL